MWNFRAEKRKIPEYVFIIQPYTGFMNFIVFFYATSPHLNDSNFYILTVSKMRWKNPKIIVSEKIRH
jgi:hypothetical protein